MGASHSVIPYGRQSIGEEDIEEVVRTLRSEFLTQGPAVPAFEKRVAEICNAGFAVAVNSATSALHLACLALDIGPEDDVWTSPITFVATSNAALYCGAKVDFVDIDPRSYNLCPERLAKKLSDAAASGKLPKAVIPVHLAGQSCDMAKIHAVAKQYGVRIIEDASHAIGGYYRGEPIGNCRYSDICVFSFHPVKIVTTGEGGMALTNDPALADSMALLRSHGITRDPELLEKKDQGGWYYEQQQLGFNYRMTDIAGALGHSQLSRLETFVARRREIAAAYDTDFSSLPVRTPWQHPDTASAWHLYVIRLNLEKSARSHRETHEFLRDSGIGVTLHYIPVYHQPFYRALGFAEGHCPNAESYYTEAISLPMYPALSEDDRRRVVDAVREAVAA